jgi:pilus assembly protein Flp/PilA
MGRTLHQTDRRRVHFSAHPAIAYVRARLALNERGAGLVEYGLLIALIALVCFAAVVFFGQSTSGQYSKITSQYPQ